MKLSRALLATAIAASLVLLVGCGDRNNNDDTAMTDTPASDAAAAGDTSATGMNDAADATAMASDGTGTGTGAAMGTDASGMGTGTGTDAAGAGTSAAAAGDPQNMASAPAEKSALGVLNAINEHEIAAGRQALDKGVSGPVAQYAQMMIDQHSENRTKTSAMGPDASAADATAQRRKGEAELKALDAKQADAYSKAYVDAMVKGHTEALAALDGKLIPAATTAGVKAHLTMTRQHVAQHLEQAKALQSGGSR